jgi:DNA modification methylase
VIHYEAEDVTVHHGDCIEVLAAMPDNSVDAIVCDPPYGLEFMGKEWDGADGFRRSLNPADTGRDNAFGRTSRTSPEYRAGTLFQRWCQQWATEALRVLKPGGHMLAFGGTRTWHRLAVAIEDAGFEMRDSIAWLYGSGFPKSLDVAKAIDKAARGVPQGGSDPTSPNHGNYRTTTTEGKRWDGDTGQGYGAGGSRFLADGPGSGSATAPAASGGAGAVVDAARQWQGWGTAMKPAFEPVVVARKPLQGTVSANVQRWGTGALNIAATRIGMGDEYDPTKVQRQQSSVSTSSSYGAIAGGLVGREIPTYNAAGRWPANVALDEFSAAALDQQSGNRPGFASQNDHVTTPGTDGTVTYGAGIGRVEPGRREGFNDSGGASRYFYTAKATAEERPKVNGIAHPTCKPLDLMRWLVRLVTPPGGTVLDPFAGSGTTLEAALREGFRCIGIERESDYLPLIVERVSRPINYTLDVFNGVSDEPEPAAAGDPWVDLALFEEGA